MPLGKKDGDRRMRAESPELDPMGDAGSEAEDLLLSFDYRREDRDSVFDGLRGR